MRKKQETCPRQITGVELYEGILWYETKSNWSNKDYVSVKEIREYLSLMTESAIQIYMDFHPVKEDFEKGGRVERAIKKLEEDN